LTFKVAVDAPEGLWLPGAGGEMSEGAVSPAVEARRVYVTREVRARLHQQGFRIRVIRAYRERCAVCRLRHEELLDAAHILPDGHPRGEPVIPNGLALCKLHHTAFDRYLLGVRPDLVVEIREDILRESDGPMLIHGLQGFQGVHIVIPAWAELQPDRELLAERFELFRSAG
jgi:putative restriction endonuclease